MSGPRERPSFLIYCDAPDHRHGRTKIRTLVLYPDGTLDAVSGGTWLSGDTAIAPDEVTRRYYDDPIPDVRFRLEFRCRQCGRSVPVRDTTRLQRIIETAWGHGESGMSLSVLDRVLSTQ